MNIFLEVELEYKKACKDLAESIPGSNDYYVVKKREVLLSSVRDIMYSYSWVKKSSSREKLEYFIRNNYSYQNMQDEFSMSKESSYTTISRLGTKFKDIIGETTINRILRGNIDIVEIEYNKQIKNIRGLFLDDIQEILPLSEEDEFVYDDILESKELKFLMFYSKYYKNNRYDVLNKQLLSHILYILESDDYKYVKEREHINVYLNKPLKNKLSK